MKALSKRLFNRIEKQKRIISEARDELREIIGELEEIDGDASEAIDGLEAVTDALSRYL